VLWDTTYSTLGVDTTEPRSSTTPSQESTQYRPWPISGRMRSVLEDASESPGCTHLGSAIRFSIAFQTRIPEVVSVDLRLFAPSRSKHCCLSKKTKSLILRSSRSCLGFVGRFHHRQFPLTRTLRQVVFPYIIFSHAHVFYWHSNVDSHAKYRLWVDQG